MLFKNLTVQGVGLGAALQRTISDPSLALPRLLMSCYRRPGSLRRNPPVRKILEDFTGVVKPGEMLLVLRAPGSGCSTFLKVLANHRYGYQSVEGDLTYGGADAEMIAKHFKNEVVYNSEDDIHYPTLSVNDTLSFALKATTDGKATRDKGRSQSGYIREYLSKTQLSCSYHRNGDEHNVLFTRMTAKWIVPVTDRICRP